MEQQPTPDAAATTTSSRRMNMFTAINDAMATALETDETAAVFGVRVVCVRIGEQSASANSKRHHPFEEVLPPLPAAIGDTSPLTPNTRHMRLR